MNRQRKQKLRGYAGTDLAVAVAVVEDVDTATPLTFMVHTDHIGRPVKMTNAARASVWDAVWTPFVAGNAVVGEPPRNVPDHDMSDRCANGLPT